MGRFHHKDLEPNTHPDWNFLCDGSSLVACGWLLDVNVCACITENDIKVGGMVRWKRKLQQRNIVDCMYNHLLLLYSFFASFLPANISNNNFPVYVSNIFSRQKNRYLYDGFFYHSFGFHFPLRLCWLVELIPQWRVVFLFKSAHPYIKKEQSLFLQR